LVIAFVSGAPHPVRIDWRSDRELSDLVGLKAPGRAVGQFDWQEPAGRWGEHYHAPVGTTEESGDTVWAATKHEYTNHHQWPCQKSSHDYRLERTKTWQSMGREKDNSNDGQ
jgi:hypothetical protein